MEIRVHTLPGIWTAPRVYFQWSNLEGLGCAFETSEHGRSPNTMIKKTEPCPDLDGCAPKLPSLECTIGVEYGIRGSNSSGLRKFGVETRWSDVLGRVVGLGCDNWASYACRRRGLGMRAVRKFNYIFIPPRMGLTLWSWRARPTASILWYSTYRGCLTWTRSLSCFGIYPLCSIHLLKMRARGGAWQYISFIR